MGIKVVVPELGESVVEATIGQWFKKEGDPVAVGDILVALETDKVDLEVGAEKSGVMGKILRLEGDDVQVGEAIAMIEAGAGAATSVAATSVAAPSAPKAAAVPVPAKEEKTNTATPVARRMAAVEGVDLTQVAGQGPQGKVTRDDVAAFLAQQEKPAVAPAMPPAFALPSMLSESRREERVKMSRRRRTIAKRLVEAQQTAAILTTFNEMDMSGVMALRSRHKEAFKAQHGISLPLSAFFVKATVGALKAFPRLNAEIQGDEMVLKQYFDIGMAIGAEEGLVVPVLRDADRMSFADIGNAIRGYAEKAKSGSLSLEDLRGGSFTITNGGVFGSMLSTPILNPPQVGILGLHNIVDRPMAVNGEVVIRPVMYVALSYDHRIVDGREAVQFLVKMKEMIEDPERLLIG